jgi:hypothetical protein
MMPGSISDRRKERQQLLAQIGSNPERDWAAQRRRVAELQRTLAFHETARP